MMRCSGRARSRPRPDGAETSPRGAREEPRASGASHLLGVAGGTRSHAQAIAHRREAARRRSMPSWRRISRWRCGRSGDPPGRRSARARDRAAARTKTAFHELGVRAVCRGRLDEAEATADEPLAAQACRNSP
jgi:hypothetical protein